MYSSRFRHTDSVRFGIFPGSVFWRKCRMRHLRHAFAVRRMMLWHAQGIDIDQAMLALSTYLGHARISNTYWYLTGVPELMALTAKKFEHFARSSREAAP
jgi:hypothetical protein